MSEHPAARARQRPRPPQRLRWWQQAWRVAVVWIVGALFWVAAIVASPAGFEQLSEIEPLAYDPLVDALLAIDLLLGQLAVAAVLLRRRWPVSIALLTAALSAFSVFAIPAMLLATLSLATRRRLPALIAVVGLSALATAVYQSVVTPVIDPLNTGPFSATFWTSLVVDLVTMGIVSLIGWNIGGRRALIESWRTQAETSHREQAARVAQARLAERARIAREMHDVLAHRLSVVAMHAGALAYRDDLPRAEVAAAAETIRSNAHTALDELREVLGVLRGSDDATAAAAPQPGLSDIPVLIAEAETRGEQVRLDAPPQLWTRSQSLPASTGRHAYRVVQEALTNARKHAPGETVTVLLDGSPDRGLTVRISNTVAASARASMPGAGLGLTGVSERVSLAGGALEAGMRQDRFVLDTWFPWGRSSGALAAHAGSTAPQARSIPQQERNDA